MCNDLQDSLIYFDPVPKRNENMHFCVFSMAQHNYKDLTFLTDEQTWLHCCLFTVRDVTLGAEKATSVPLKLHKECSLFLFNSYNWESLADCFDWSHRAVRESVSEQPTIDSCTFEGLRSIGGNKSCVKIIFWCGALSAYWFVIICTNSGRGRDNAIHYCVKIDGEINVSGIRIVVKSTTAVSLSKGDH